MKAIKILFFGICIVLLSCGPSEYNDDPIEFKCYDVYRVYYYALDDISQCGGERLSVDIRTNEKYRLESVLAFTTDECVKVKIKYYFIGIKLYVDGYIKNSSSTIKQIKDCN
jgi:hypothetical protein